MDMGVAIKQLHRKLTGIRPSHVANVATQLPVLGVTS